MPPIVLRLIRSRRGTAAIEFAILAPVIIALTAGIVEFGRIFQVYNSLNRLATQYAIAWADCSDFPQGTCATELATYTPVAAIKNIVPQLTSTPIVQMFQVEMAGTTPNVKYAYPTSATLTTAQITAARAVLTDKQFGVIVTATYQHALIYFPNQMSGFLPNSILRPSFTVVQLKY